MHHTTYSAAVLLIMATPGAAATAPPPPDSDLSLRARYERYLATPFASDPEIAGKLADPDIPELNKQRLLASRLRNPLSERLPFDVAAIRRAARQASTNAELDIDGDGTVTEQDAEALKELVRASLQDLAPGYGFFREELLARGLADPELGPMLAELRDLVASELERCITSTCDSDGDGVEDLVDNCPEDPNPDQANQDMDPLGDACDPDDDNDGIEDALDECRTIESGTNPCEEIGCSLSEDIEKLVAAIRVPGIATTLRQRTAHGCELLQNGNVAAARRVYRALFNFVSAQEGKHIPVDVAQDLKRAARILAGLPLEDSTVRKRPRPVPQRVLPSPGDRPGP